MRQRKQSVILFLENNDFVLKGMGPNSMAPVLMSELQRSNIW
jgi:hypothetical protein